MAKAKKTSRRARPADESADAPTRIELDDDRARELVHALVKQGLVTWPDVATQVLQAMQPPQTATHVPQLPGIRARHKARERWAPARAWMLATYAPCPLCGSTMRLTHDHVLERELLHDAADMLENLRFLCYRCNQSRHWKHGGRLTLGTAAASTYLLLTQKPPSVEKLTKLGRDLGLTQSGQRFEESWALAMHLHRAGKYVVERPHSTLSHEQAERLRAYYLEANAFFAALKKEIVEAIPAKRHRRWELLRVLVTTRHVDPADRIAAAKRLGMTMTKALTKKLSSPHLSESTLRRILSVGGIAPTDVTALVSTRNRLVSLWHLMSQKERAAISKRIAAGIAALRKKHGIA